jgi:hypothetical protein
MVLRFPSRSPRRPGFVASVIGVMRSIVANLTPALVCQDHTTSPSARNITRQLMCRVHRIPHSRFVTIAIRPSCRRRDAGDHAADLGFLATPQPCGRMARRAICTWQSCKNCPTSKAASTVGPASQNVEREPWQHPARYRDRRRRSGVASSHSAIEGCSIGISLDNQLMRAHPS